MKNACLLGRLGVDVSSRYEIRRACFIWQHHIKGPNAAAKKNKACTRRYDMTGTDATSAAAAAAAYHPRHRARTSETESFARTTTHSTRASIHGFHLSSPSPSLIEPNNHSRALLYRSGDSHKGPRAWAY